MIGKGKMSRQKVLNKKFRSEEIMIGTPDGLSSWSIRPLSKWHASVRHSVHCMSQMDKLLPGRVSTADDFVEVHRKLPLCVSQTANAPSTSVVSPAAAASAATATVTAVAAVSVVSADMCRICHCEATADAPLIAPCYCSGSLKYVHQRCLQQWIKSSQTKACEVCRFSFIMETKVKPFRKWEKLDISSVERRKIFCSVAFHFIAITCVIWSLYVLMDRTAEEIREGHIDWPFWTKLVVVAIGFSGGIVFMYVQCKMYVQLFRRWKAYNKVIYVGNCPDFPKQDLARCDKT